MRLLRTLRLDASDGVIFDPAAAAGEWAVPGTFLFAGTDPAALPRKAQTAFRSGFLGTASFGFSTLATVVDVPAADWDAAVATLAAGLVRHCGAPDAATATPAAAEEMALARDLAAAQPVGTVIALHRSHGPEGITERFRSLRPRERTALAGPGLAGHDRAFHIVDTGEDDAPGLSLADLALRGADDA